MRKAWWGLCGAVLILFSSWGWNEEVALEPPVSSGPAEEQFPDGKSVELVPERPFLEYEKVIDPLFLAGACGFPWESGGELPSDCLLDFYMVDTLYPQFPGVWKEPVEVPAETVLEGLEESFDGVAAGQIRQAAGYSPEKDTISFSYGVGSGSIYQITQVEKQGDRTLIHLTCLEGDSLDTPTKQVTVGMKDEKYLFCQVEELVGDGAYQTVEQAMG